MTKRILSLLLIAIISITSIFWVACDKSNNSDNDSQETGESYQSTTCHDGIGSCTICGLDYYDALVDYIKSNGTLDQKQNTYCLEYTLSSWDEPVNVVYFKTTDSIAIGGYSYAAYIVSGYYDEELGEYVFDESKTYLEEYCSNYIYITKSKIAYGLLDWKIKDSSGNEVGGTLQATSVFPDTVINLYNGQNKYDNDFDFDDVDIRAIINKTLPAFLKDSGTNISMNNLGFEKFED